MKVNKNKVAPPFRQCEFDIIYGQGISQSGCLIDEGTDLGVIEKTGTWFSYKEQRLGQGRDNAREFLNDHPEVAHAIEQEIRQQVGLAPAMVAPPDPQPGKEDDAEDE